MDQGIVSGGNFIVGILLARYLNLETYGEYALIWLIVLFCSSLHQGWIITPMFTFSPQYAGEERTSYFKTLWVHQILFAIGAALFSSIFLWLAHFFFSEWNLGNISYLIPMVVFLFLMYDFFRREHYAKETPHKALWINIFVFGSQIAGIVFLQFTHALNLYSALFTVGISYSIALLFGVKHLLSFQWDFSFFKQITIKHWNFSKWLIGTALLQWVSGNFFIIAAASILSPLTVGAIRILQNIVGVLHVFFLALENYIPLKATKIYYANGIKALRHFLVQVSWKGGLATLLISLTMAFFGKEIMTLLYGEKHLNYAYLLYGFALLYTLVFIGTNIRFAIRTLEQTRSIFIAYILSSGFSLVMAKPIIEKWGIDGIVIGLIITQVIMQLFFLFSLKQKKIKSL